LLREITTVLKEREMTKQFEDEEWLFDLAFLADFIGKLSDINIELQGKTKCIAEMNNTVSSQKRKFEPMMADLTNINYDHFTNVQNYLEKYPNFVFQTEKYVTEIRSVIQHFGNRFCDFQKIKQL
jgi:hypothetical protein